MPLIIHFRHDLQSRVTGTQATLLNGLQKRPNAQSLRFDAELDLALEIFSIGVLDLSFATE